MQIFTCQPKFSNSDLHPGVNSFAQLSHFQFAVRLLILPFSSSYGAWLNCKCSLRSLVQHPNPFLLIFLTSKHVLCHKSSTSPPLLLTLSLNSCGPICHCPFCGPTTPSLTPYTTRPQLHLLTYGRILFLLRSFHLPSKISQLQHYISLVLVNDFHLSHIL